MTSTSKCPVCFSKDFSFHMASKVRTYVSDVFQARQFGAKLPEVSCRCSECGHVDRAYRFKAQYALTALISPITGRTVIERNTYITNCPKADMLWKQLSSFLHTRSNLDVTLDGKGILDCKRLSWICKWPSNIRRAFASHDAQTRAVMNTHTEHNAEEIVTRVLLEGTPYAQMIGVGSTVMVGIRWGRVRLTSTVNGIYLAEAYRGKQVSNIHFSLVLNVVGELSKSATKLFYYVAELLDTMRRLAQECSSYQQFYTHLNNDNTWPMPYLFEYLNEKYLKLLETLPTHEVAR